MNKKLTRRQLVSAAAGSAAVSAVALTVIAQAPPSSPSSQDFDKAAVESHKENSDALAKFEIPMALEPAFHFRA
jgi:hypothetical protein